MIPIGDSPVARRVPYVTVALIVANVLVFFYQLTLDPRELTAFVQTFGVVPAAVTSGEPLPIGVTPYLTLITSMFIHAGILHIGGNMLFLWIFGDNVESVLGHLTYAGFYLASGFGASFLHIILSPDSTVPAIGASGAISGVLAAYVLYFPEAQVRTLIVLIPFVTITRLSALFLIGFWIVLQVLSGLAQIATPAVGGVAYWAHVGGFVTGLGLAYLMRPGGKTSQAT